MKLGSKVIFQDNRHKIVGIVFAVNNVDMDICVAFESQSGVSPKGLIEDFNEYWDNDEYEVFTNLPNGLWSRTWIDKRELQPLIENIE